MKTSARPSPSTPRTLVGRDRELDTLERWMDEARAGRGTTVVIHGDAGIGKSALAHALATRAAELGMATLTGQSDELTRGRPFGALLDATRRIASVDAEWEMLVTRLRKVEHVDPLDAFGTVTAPWLQAVELAADTIERSTMRQPLVIVADDLQWIDPATLATITTLQRRIANLPLLWVLTWRTPDAALVPFVGTLVGRGGRELEIEALDRTATSTLAGTLLGAPPAENTIELLRRAAGNPLYLTELTRAMRDRGLVEIRDGRAHATDAPLPASLRMVLAARLAGQPPDALAVLRVAAVLGMSFSLESLAVVTGRPAALVTALVMGLSDAGLVTDARDGLQFSHPLLREVLYVDLPQELRRRMHLQIAEALIVAGTPAGDVAEHLLAGPPPSHERAARLFADAGRQLIDRQPPLAVRLLRAAAGVLCDDCDRGPLLADLVDALVATDASDEVDALLDELATMEVAGLRLRVHVHRARQALRSGSFDEAHGQLRAALALPDLAPATAARLAADDAIVGVLHADPTALASARLAVATAERVGDDATVAMGLGIQAYLAMLDTQMHDASQLAHASLARFERVPNRSASQFPHLFVAAVLSYTGPLEESLAVCDLGRRLAEEQGQMMWAIPSFGVTASLCHMRRGDLDNAEAEARAAIRAHEELGLRVGVSWAWAQVAAVQALRGDVTAAQASLVAAAATGDAVGSTVGVLWRGWAHSLLLADDDPAAALQVLLDAWAPGQPLPGMEIVAPAVVRLAMLLDDDHAKAVVLGELDRLELGDPNDADRALTAWCRAMLVQDADSIQVQAALLHGHGRRYHAALARQSAGELLAATGRTAEAVELLTAAADEFDAIGATAPGQRVCQLADRLGRRTRRRSPRPSTGWGALTDTEWEVVRMAVDGLSNPDIGHRMFISRRTVETHLSHVYVKLGITSRIELVGAYLRRDATA